MTDQQILTWIKTNLSATINHALDDSRKINPQLLYTESWLAGINMRETGLLIFKKLTEGKNTNEMHLLMRGDYSQRKGETKPQYHGFGYMQIDIASFPDFVNSGAWKDPYKTYMKAISVLEGKRKYLQQKFPALQGEELQRAITAAYNCGEGNVGKVLLRKLDIDAYTAEKNYSKEVWRYRKIYSTLLHSEN